MATRLTGTSGAVYVKVSGVFVKITDIFDWRFEVGTKLLNCRSKGDFIDRWKPSHNEGAMFTAKRRNEGASKFSTFISDDAINATQTTWRLDLVDNNNTFTQITVNGYARHTALNAPGQAGVEETFELVVDDSWSYNV